MLRSYNHTEIDFDMFSLSTSWNFFRYISGVELVREIKAIGFDTIELNFALTESMVKDVLGLSQRSEIKVSSLHNICPLPPETEQAEASPDYYSLASRSSKFLFPISGNN